MLYVRFIAPLTLCCVLAYSFYVLGQRKEIRQVKGLPTGRFGWILEKWGDQLFLVYLTGKRDVVELLNKPQSPFVFPFPVAVIDHNTEQVVAEFTSKHRYPVAIVAEIKQRPDSWLAQEYDYWVIDVQTNTVYALKPTSWKERVIGHYEGVYVIDLGKRQVKNFLEISPVFTIAFHPHRRKLYVMTRPKEAEVETGEVQVYSAMNLSLLKTITYTGGVFIWDAEFTQDGDRLFCCVEGRGILVINTKDDELESWLSIKDRSVVSLALASDEKELYIALHDGLERGAVAAIDIAQKKLVRTLELSQTGCTSVVVVGDKLFAACLDGVYVIDIPAWRQK